MELFHNRCPLCNKIHKGLCINCLTIVQNELKSSYMDHICPHCFTHVLHTDSICTCDLKSPHYTLFDNTEVVVELIASFDRYQCATYVSQMCEILHNAIREINLPGQVILFSDIHSETYSKFLKKIIIRFNRNINFRDRKQTFPIYLSINKANQNFISLSFIDTSL